MRLESFEIVGVRVYPHRRFKRGPATTSTTPPSIHTCGPATPLLAATTLPTADDVGWLKNIDSYYANTNNSIQHAGVEQILDSSIASLQRNPDRKFIYVEQAFFQRWWVSHPEMQSTVKKLVATGQLTFVNGGWAMHDEAAPSYLEMADNMAAGHRHILRQFGPEAAPRAAWSIDPFGACACTCIRALCKREHGYFFKSSITYGFFIWKFILSRSSSFRLSAF